MGGPTNKSNPNGGTSNKKNVIKKTMKFYGKIKVEFRGCYFYTIIR